MRTRAEKRREMKAENKRIQYEKSGFTGGKKRGPFGPVYSEGYIEFTGDRSKYLANGELKNV